MLLAGMLLSQLIEEKSNKIIEVLAAAVPIDAIFLGKLFAMLAMSLRRDRGVGRGRRAAIAHAGTGQAWRRCRRRRSAGRCSWRLAVVYFVMSYLLLGAVFLGIGAQASTVREVQTLSMPVTMAQVVMFALAATAVGEPDSRAALAAAIFPLSSPFVMMARAAEQPQIWPHLVAIAWQALWVGADPPPRRADVPQQRAEVGPGRRSVVWHRKRADKPRPAPRAPSPRSLPSTPGAGTAHG